MQEAKLQLIYSHFNTTMDTCWVLPDYEGSA